MAHGWHDFPILTEPPVVVEDHPRERVVLIGARRFLELPDNGYQLLLAWEAGPDRVARGSGPAVPEADQAVIDEFVNGYLDDADVPPRPRGFRWYLELPAPLEAADVWAAVRPDAAHLDQVTPAQEREAMRRGLTELYA